MILVPIRLHCGCRGEEHPDTTITVKVHVLEPCGSHSHYRGKYLFFSDVDVAWRDEAMSKLAQEWLARTS